MAGNSNGRPEQLGAQVVLAGAAETAAATPVPVRIDTYSVTDRETPSISRRSARLCDVAAEFDDDTGELVPQCDTPAETLMVGVQVATADATVFDLHDDLVECWCRIGDVAGALSAVGAKNDRPHQLFSGRPLGHDSA